MNTTFEFLPDFVVIGAMKAGTSTLFLNLFDNPEIQRTKKKEVNFFLEDINLEQLNSKYRSQYSTAMPLKCDVSPKYSQRHSHSGVPAKIHKANPETKIIYITRDPIDRILSHLQHDLLRDRFDKKNINERVFAERDYIECSKYYHQIDAYLEFFSKESILVLMVEEIKADPQNFCKRINTFLGTQSITCSDRNYNVSEKRFKIFRYDQVNDLIRSRFLLKVYHRFCYTLNIKVEKPALTNDVKNRLIGELKDDTLSFVNEFGLDLGLWKNFKNLSK